MVKDCIGKASRNDFRVVHFSVQGNHLHLIVEAADDRLSSGAHGLAIRVARQVNRVLGRSGRFWDDRYHARTLETPREVRNAIVYVLMNAKKHHPGEAPDIDPCSSAAWFDGFRESVARPAEPAPVRPSATWLGTIGWRIHGLLSRRESPHSRPRPRTRRASAPRSPRAGISPRGRSPRSRPRR